MASEIGNRYAQQWTEENALPRFEDALKYATEDDDCLCMQDAVAQTGIPITTFYYLVENHKVLKSIKDDIAAQIVRRVNKGAIRDQMAASPAIWRMKQLGERDQQYLEQSGTTTVNTTITVAGEGAKEKIDELINKFNQE